MIIRVVLNEEEDNNNVTEETTNKSNNPGSSSSKTTKSKSTKKTEETTNKSNNPGSSSPETIKSKSTKKPSYYAADICTFLAEVKNITGIAKLNQNYFKILKINENDIKLTKEKIKSIADKYIKSDENNVDFIPLIIYKKDDSNITKYWVPIYFKNTFVKVTLKKQEYRLPFNQLLLFYLTKVSTTIDGKPLNHNIKSINKLIKIININDVGTYEVDREIINNYNNTQLNLLDLPRYTLSKSSDIFTSYSLTNSDNETDEKSSDDPTLSSNDSTFSSNDPELSTLFTDYTTNYDDNHEYTENINGDDTLNAVCNSLATSYKNSVQKRREFLKTEIRKLHNISDNDVNTNKELANQVYSAYWKKQFNFEEEIAKRVILVLRESYESNISFGPDNELEKKLEEIKKSTNSFFIKKFLDTLSYVPNLWINSYFNSSYDLNYDFKFEIVVDSSISDWYLDGNTIYIGTNMSLANCIYMWAKIFERDSALIQGKEKKFLSNINSSYVHKIEKFKETGNADDFLKSIEDYEYIYDHIKGQIDNTGGLLQNISDCLSDTEYLLYIISSLDSKIVDKRLSAVIDDPSRKTQDPKETQDPRETQSKNLIAKLKKLNRKLKDKKYKEIKYTNKEILSRLQEILEQLKERKQSIIKSIDTDFIYRYITKVPEYKLKNGIQNSNDDYIPLSGNNDDKNNNDEENDPCKPVEVIDTNCIIIGRKEFSNIDSRLGICNIDKDGNITSYELIPVAYQLLLTDPLKFKSRDNNIADVFNWLLEEIITKKEIINGRFVSSKAKSITLTQEKKKNDIISEIRKIVYSLITKNFKINTSGNIHDFKAPSLKELPKSNDPQNVIDPKNPQNIQNPKNNDPQNVIDPKNIQNVIGSYDESKMTINTNNDHIKYILTITLGQSIKSKIIETYPGFSPKISNFSIEKITNSNYNEEKLLENINEQINKKLNASIVGALKKLFPNDYSVIESQGIIPVFEQSNDEDKHTLKYYVTIDACELEDISDARYDAKMYVEVLIGSSYPHNMYYFSTRKIDDDFAYDDDLKSASNNLYVKLNSFNDVLKYIKEDLEILDDCIDEQENRIKEQEKQEER